MRKLDFFLFPCLLSLPLFSQTAPSEHGIVVRSLVIGASPKALSPDEQEQITRDVQAHKYASTDLSESVAQRVRYGFEVLGYFKAEVGRPSIMVVHEMSRQSVADVSVSVVEGGKYRLKAISFTGGKVFSAGELRRAFPIEDGDVFNVESIRKGLEDLRLLYEAKGYVNFTPVPNTVVDDSCLTISLQTDLDEGVQFHAGRLTVLGVEAQPGAGARLLKSWKKYEGQVYSWKLVEEFLRENIGLLPSNLRPEADVEVSQQPVAHTINVWLDMPDATGTSR